MSTHRPAKHDHTIYVTIRGIRTRHAGIEAAEKHYQIEAEGARALIEYSDGTTETWRY